MSSKSLVSSWVQVSDHGGEKPCSKPLLSARALSGAPHRLVFSPDLMSGLVAAPDFARVDKQVSDTDHHPRNGSLYHFGRTHFGSGHYRITWRPLERPQKSERQYLLVDGDMLTGETTRKVWLKGTSATTFQVSETFCCHNGEARMDSRQYETGGPHRR